MIFSLIQKITWIVMYFLTHFVFKFEVIGKENIQNLKPPLIVVSNHKSYWDHYFFGFAINKNLNAPFFPMRFLASDYLFFKTWLGPFILLYGGFRNYKGRGLEVSLKKPINILKNNGTVIFYPEGGMVRDVNKIGEPKKGIGALSLWSKARILPVAIKGSRDKKNGIKVIFGQPFFIKDYIVPQSPKGSEEDFVKASRIIMDRVKELYFSV